MTSYQTLSMGYSAVYNKRVTRVSVIDDNGDEFWMMIPTLSGRGQRDATTKALDTIQDAIDRGDAPGQVEV